MKIVALSGSLRAESSNSRLLRAAAALAPATMAFTYYDRQLSEIPAFTPDLDGDDAVPPPSVAAFRAALSSADGVLISCPEYAHGVPGAFKNALDWLVSSSSLSGKPTAVLMASPSGAEMARAALLPTLRVIEADVVFDASIRFSRIHLDTEGRILDEAIAAVVRESLSALAAAVSAVAVRLPPREASAMLAPRCPSFRRSSGSVAASPSGSSVHA